jgi:YkoY family integral membrane protein
MLLVLNMTDIFAIFFLIFLEGALSLDNALVLALMTKHLPSEKRKKALTYGIWGAFAFRFIALFFLTHLMNMDWIKWIGGGYLIYLALKSLVFGDEEPEERVVGAMTFWRTVLMVELMDIAFSVDSILAAVSLTQSYWIVLFGGLVGIVMMRFAANVFVGLINRFPRLNKTAYLLVLIIGVKLFIQGFNLPEVDFHSSTNPASWLFWFAMTGSALYGFKGKKKVHA